MQLSWTPYFGQGLLYSSTLLAALVCVAPNYKKTLFGLLWLTLIAAFFWLIYAHLTSDFSFLNVVMNSHTQKPLLYKISGVWGNHEGSMLLWLVLLITVGGWAFRHNESGLSLIAYVGLAVLLFLVLACNPFTSVLTPPAQGHDLNPVLQDPLLAIHPPLLYLGVVTSIIPLILSSLNQWGRSWMFWSVFSWTFLTIGVCLGSFWAYYELGWGGWWFWDPVENAALVPWLLQTAAIHSMILVNRGRLALSAPKWFSFSVFATCLLGTFMVRSGLVTSVHSFAVDPERGLFLALVCGVVLIPFATRLIAIKGQGAQLPESMTVNLSSALKLGIFFLGFSAFVVAFGTTYPIFLQVFGIQLTVGAPYFNATVIPIMIPILALMAMQPWLTMVRIDLQKSIPPVLIAGSAVLIMWYQFHMDRALILIGYGAGLWLVTSMVFGLIYRLWSKAQIPMILAHTGVGLAVLGMSISIGFEQEKLIALKPGETSTFSGQQLSLIGMQGEKAENYMGQTARLILNDKIKLSPQKRFYWTQGIIHQETAIYSSGFDHYYVSMGDRYDNDAWGFRLMYKPGINLMWFGFFLMGFAGTWSLVRRGKSL